MPNKTIRLTVVDKLYHQVPGNNPTHVSVGFTRELADDEQPFVRSPKKPLTERIKVDTGWIPSPSFVIIENRGGGDIGVTFEDCPEYFVVKAGEGQRFSPFRSSLMEIFPTDGEPLYTITAIPE
jgi:hypothetical protein